MGLKDNELIIQFKFDDDRFGVFLGVSVNQVSCVDPEG